MCRENESPAVGGVVLCGGHSRRMGEDKPWLPWGGQTMLQHTVDRLAGDAKPIVVVGAVHQKLPPLPRAVRVVSDEVPDQGPLRGFQAGLAAIADDCDLAFLVGCDTPLLRPEFVRFMAKRIGGKQAVAVRDKQRWYPLGAAYRCDVTSVIDQVLGKGRCGLRDLLAALDCAAIEPQALHEVDPKLASLRNVNTPEDYRLLLTEFGSSP